MEFIVGADVGASSTKVAVADPSGRLLAVVRAPGANPYTVGLAEAARTIRSTVDRALQQAAEAADQAVGPDESAPGARTKSASPGGSVTAMVVGLAGGTRTFSDERFLSSISASGMTGRARLLSDLAVAFSSATPENDGYVLIAGTGAVAGEIHTEDLIGQRDGWGWLLGDAGSGFWLGREAVRSTLRAFEDCIPLTPLHDAVLRAAGAADRGGLVQACYARPPIWLASLADLITAHAADDSARTIAEEAAGHLAELVTSLVPRPDRPIVLAGSVATEPGPVATMLRQHLDERLPNRLLLARSGLVGAVWAAVRSLGGAGEDVHRRLTESLDRYPDSARQASN